MADFVGGLASGIDSGLIIQKLVSLQSRPIALIKNRQAALNTQVSAIADLASKLSALGKASASLKSEGVRATRVASTAASFEATATSAARPGTFSLSVEQLATAAKTRSQGFAAPNSQVRAGSLHLEVRGEAFDVEITEGMSLVDVADAIAASGAPVSATVLSDGRQAYLSITNNQTGHAIDEAPDSALVITQTLTGTAGAALFTEDPADPAAPVTIRAAAQNARFFLDGLAIERTGNEIDDLLPGVRLVLKSPSRIENGAPVAESLVLAEDRSGTKARLQSFVDAYNAVATLLRRQTAASDLAAGPLAGDSVARSLEQDLQALIGQAFPGRSLESLAAAGLKVERNGTITLDAERLDDVLARNPAALDGLFAGDGVDLAVQGIVRKYLDGDVGLITQRRLGLQDTIDRLADDIEAKQRHIEAYQETLVRRFTALEETIAKLNSTKNYLDQLDKAREKK